MKLYNTVDKTVIAEIIPNQDQMKKLLHVIYLLPYKLSKTFVRLSYARTVRPIRMLLTNIARDHNETFRHLFETRRLKYTHSFNAQ